MPQWLIDLTQPQATLGSGALTFLGAVVAVVLGWWLFSGKVKDVKSALDASDKLLKDHQARVQQSLADIEEKLGGLAASIGRVQADVSDTQAVEQAGGPAVENQPEEVQLTFDDFAKSWVRIRDRLEDIASDSRIDGRTAAKYSRIDRRNYADLVSSLSSDGRLGELAPQFHQAARTWASHRTRRRMPPPDVIERMLELADLLAPAE